VSYDALFSLIPILLLVFFILSTTHYLLSDAASRTASQEKFNLLVAVADYLVKGGAAYKEGGKVYPNWIDGAELDAEKRGLAEMRGMLGLPALEFGLEGADGYGREPGKTCIYRIVVYGREKEPDRLFVCG